MGANHFEFGKLKTIEMRMTKDRAAVLTREEFASTIPI